MRLVSWNVNGRTAGALDAQASALAGTDPDLVALQEVTRQSAPEWRECLAESGRDRQGIGQVDVRKLGDGGQDDRRVAVREAALESRVSRALGGHTNACSMHDGFHSVRRCATGMLARYRI